jgi:acyl-CoA hydrolase
VGDSGIFHHRSADTAAPHAAGDIIDHLGPRTELIVPLANGEPTALLDEIERAVAASPDRFEALRVHQMHAMHERPYLNGAYGDRMRHISYFLSHITRPHFRSGAVELVPAHFSEVYALMRGRIEDPLVIAAASPPDRHGYFSLGVSADYTASFIGRARFFLEATDAMPRTFGRNQIHASQVVGWCRSDRPLIDVEPAVPDTASTAIAAGRFSCDASCCVTSRGTASRSSSKLVNEMKSVAATIAPTYCARP